jgi:FAD/FMN-containing dehydrogenase/Fe-S oxidoreductase
MAHLEKLPNDKYPISDIFAKLQKSIAGEVRIDKASRILYSTDASIYQIEPIGVIFPRSLDDLCAVVEIADQHNAPILARGAGTSLAGQAIGRAWIIDCSRYLNKIIDINSEDMTAVVEPGVILDDLNRHASTHGLRFGPDPASSERATIGGCIANNAAGANSILYGMAADHLISADVVLADGSQTTFESLMVEEVLRKAGVKDSEDIKIDQIPPGEFEKRLKFSCPVTLEANIYRTALLIQQQLSSAIQENWPKTWRRASGYNLNYLLPWSPSSPPQWYSDRLPYPPIEIGNINIAPLLAGSEGTLAVFKQLRLRLVPKHLHSILFVLPYPSLSAACDDVVRLLTYRPSAVELIPKNLIRLAMSVPAYAKKAVFLRNIGTVSENSSRESATIPEAILVVEFSGDDEKVIKEQAKKFNMNGFLADSPEMQKDIWALRKAGLGILMSRTEDTKPLSFIEDLSVPVERLGEFVVEMERILTNHSTSGDFYAHASAGCLHLRPLINLKSPAGISTMRSIATEAVALTLRLGGSVSGEHGDGLSRSEWLENTFGQEILNAFNLLKKSADPKGLLNPGKILDSPRMDTNLRIQAISNSQNWQKITKGNAFDYSKQGGFINAVEQCNGAGVCRKKDGVMCPSFQVTHDEMHSTRGRANLLRALLYGTLPDKKYTQKILYEALDLCLACKGCKSECPSKVDMAKLKYEFLYRYYSFSGFNSNFRPVRDYLFAYIGLLAQIGYRFAGIVNFTLRNQIARYAAWKALGISSKRAFPSIKSKSFQKQASNYIKHLQMSQSLNPSEINKATCIFMPDAFIEYFQPEVGMAALKALIAAGYQVEILPIIGAGRTLISKGFLGVVRKQAEKLILAIKTIDPQGKYPVVGIEPSEVYTLRDEYLDLMPGDSYVENLSKRVFTIEELLVRPMIGVEDQDMRIVVSSITKHATNLPKILLHAHCYQEAQPPSEDGYPNGVAATVRLLETAGYQVSLANAGCCGMAGAFGYEDEHYDLSIEIGELALFPAIREAIRLDESVIVTTSGVSCQSQINDGAQVDAIHPIMLI